MATDNSQFATIALLPGGQNFPATAGETILEAGRRAGFTFPQACSGGNCLRCACTLLRGAVEHRRSHEHIAVDGESTTVLPCLVAARGDCTLAVEGIYGPGQLPVVEVAAQVVAIEPLSDQISRVHLRLPAGRHVERLAGQYLEILDGAGAGVLSGAVSKAAAYAFSIASPPESGRDLELHIRYGEENPSSLDVMALLRREPMVTLRLPMGDCTLAGEPLLPVLYIAGSTGFAQVKAFVEHAIARRWTVPMAIYWGVRSLAELYLAELPERWAREHGNIRFVPVISSGVDEAMHCNPIRTGLVHGAALADVDDFGRLLVYACGSPAMVYAAQDAFVAHGLPAERFFSDVFAWAARP